MFAKTQQKKELSKQQGAGFNSVFEEASSNFNDLAAKKNKSCAIEAIKNKTISASKAIKRNYTFSFDDKENYVYNLENDDVTPRIPAMPVLRSKRLADEHSCGTMKNVCTSCGALCYRNEANVSGLCKSCCYLVK